MTINVCIRGGGDLGSGVAFRLHQAGCQIVICELPMPLVVRRTVAFAEAIFSGSIDVEGIRAVRCAGQAEAAEVISQGNIPVVVDGNLNLLSWYQADCIVDARLLKKHVEQNLAELPMRIGLGPGFTAGLNCHAVVETKRGHRLGRVYWRGSGEMDSGVPETIQGHNKDRVLRAPTDGVFFGKVRIGQQVSQGTVLAEIANQQVIAAFDGVVRGLLGDGVMVSHGVKVGDLDPRLDDTYINQISDKSLSVGGGVLEAILAYPLLRQKYCE